MAFRNEAYEVQNLINIYRANPNMFDSDQLDVLQNKANQYGINFKPLKDTTTLTSLAKNFSGGFVRGLVPLVPPDEQPRTTYEAIAQSLGHLAGFAPSILSVPLKGVTKGLKTVGAISKKKYVSEVAGETVEGFIGQRAIGVLDKISLPMGASRLAKAGLGKGISKLELDTLDFMKTGGVTRSIAEEAVGLGTASVVSNIWAGPDEYMNTFFGGALAGGVFGGIGNWRALGNRLGLAKTEGQRTRAEDAIKAAVGSAFQGLPATLRKEPIEMQLYEYLLGGFFGYKSRPAAEAEGGKFILETNSLHPEYNFKLENTFKYQDLSKGAKEYAQKRSTAAAEAWLSDTKHFNGDLNALVNYRLRNESSKLNDSEARNKEIRNIAYEEYRKQSTRKEQEKINQEIISEDSMDEFDFHVSTPMKMQNISRNIYKSLGDRSKLTSIKDINKILQDKIDAFSKEGDTIIKVTDPDAFMKSVQSDKLIGEWAKQPKNSQALYNMFATKNKVEYAVKVFNNVDKTITTEEPGTKSGLTYIGVLQHSNPLLDGFGAGKGFSIMSHVKKIDSNKITYEPFLEYNAVESKNKPVGFNINPKDIILELAKTNEYLYAGVKSKPFSITAQLKDLGLTIESLKDYTGKEYNALKAEYDKSEKQFLSIMKPEAKDVKNIKDLHRRQFISNILYELEFHGFTQRNGLADVTQLPKILNENFFKNAVDFNKRMQGYAESSGMPMNPNTFKKSIGSNELRFLILNDDDFMPDAKDNRSWTDGGMFFRPEVFKDIIRVLGFNPKTDNIKPVVMGRVTSPVNKGLAFLKTSGKNSEGQPSINKIMNNPDAPVDFVVFSSGNKIKGLTKETRFNFNENTNEYEMMGQAEVHKVPVESLRINPSVYENPVVNKGINIPRQFFITLNEHQSPETLKTFIQHYFENVEGSNKTKNLVAKFEETGNIEPIKKFLKSSRYSLDEMPFNFVIKMLKDTGSNGDLFRRALQRIDGESNKELESFIFDAAKNYEFYHDSSTNLAGLNNGRYGFLNFNEKLNTAYFNSIKKFTMRKLTTPYWKYGSKAVLNPVTKDVFATADTIKPIKSIKPGEILLDLAQKDMNVKINLTQQQIKDLNNVKKGINNNGESTLGHVWDLYKISQGLGTPEQANRYNFAGKKANKAISDALDLLVIRVPADSLSGIRSLRFMGFTKHKGAGATTHRKDDKYLGGADKDIDSIFIVQNGSRSHIKEVRKVRNEREGWDTKEIESRFADNSKQSLYSKYSPVARLASYATGRQGAAQRGLSIAARDSLLELYAQSQAKGRNGRLPVFFSIEDAKQGRGTNTHNYNLVVRKDGIKKLLQNVYGNINVNNDSTNFAKIKSSEEARRLLFNSLFKIEEANRLNRKDKKDTQKQTFKLDSLNESIVRASFVQEINKFHSRFKTNPFNPEYKKYEDMFRAVKDTEGFEFFGPSGRMFQYGKNLNIFNNIKDAELAGNINMVIRPAIKEYTSNAQEQAFLKKFLGIAETPIKNLQTDKELTDQISVNLSKLAGHRLLVENALNVYRTMPKAKQKSIDKISNELSKIYRKAQEHRGHAMDFDIRGSFKYKDGFNIDTTVRNIQVLDNIIRNQKFNLIDFAKKNKLNKGGAESLIKYYETALLIPEKVPSRALQNQNLQVYRSLNQLYGSKEISNISKKQFIDKFNDLFTEVSKFEKAEDIPIKFLEQSQPKYESIVSNVGKTLFPNLKPEDLAYLATTKSDYAELNKLKNNLENFKQIDNLNEFFIDFTSRRRGDAKDLSAANINDIKALNQFFEYTKSGKNKLSFSTWLVDPRTISDRDIAQTINKYEGLITPFRTGSGKVKYARIGRYMTPLAAQREFIKRTHNLQNAEVDKIANVNERIFDWTKYGLTKNEQQHVMNHISNRRNPEPEKTLTDKDNAFLNKRFKGKTGEQIVQEYNNKFTVYVDGIAKDYIYTYDTKGNRVEFEKLIDTKNVDFSKGIKINDHMRFKKDGSFDLNHFNKSIIRPITTGRQINKTSIESILRAQYETIMENQLKRAKNNNLEGRIRYRQKKKFKDFSFGYIKPEEYFMRTNYGRTEKDRRDMLEDIKRLAAEGKDSYESMYLQLENTMRDSARVEDNFLNIQYEMIDKNYKDVGYKSKPKNLLQRGENFIRGYDKRPDILNKYKDQIIKTYYNNLIALYGNQQIELFKTKGKPLETLTAKQLAKLKEAGYESNTDLWSDFLYIYLKNSLGHPSLLTHRIRKSMEKGDPLNLKRNPYYLTSDYAVTKSLEKIYKTNRFNKLPFLRNAPEDPALRRDYFVRRVHELGAMEARYNLLTLLANTGTMMTNLYGGASQTIGSASFKSFIESKKDSIVTERLLQDKKGNFVLSFKNNKPVKNRKDLVSWLIEDGLIDTYLKNELENNPKLKSSIGKLGKESKNFIKDIKVNIKRGERNESFLQLAERYGIKDSMLKYGGFFMQFGERVNRVDAFIAHALKAQERLGRYGRNTNLADKYLYDQGLAGIEATQYLYHSAFRPAFMTTALGKVLTRFKLFAFQSVRTRKEFYKQAKAYGFQEGTPEYEKFKDLFLTDMFAYAMAGAYMYSLFDTALPPPWDWMQDTADLMFGDKKERDRAFYGTLPRPIAPLQVALPPIARFPQTFVELIQGDWEKFSDYTIHTMYPFGRLYYSAKKTKERPERFMHNFFRLPTDKISYRIKREQIRDARQERIDEFLDEG